MYVEVVPQVYGAARDTTALYSGLLHAGLTGHLAERLMQGTESETLMSRPSTMGQLLVIFRINRCAPIINLNVLRVHFV